MLPTALLAAVAPAQPLLPQAVAPAPQAAPQHEAQPPDSKQFGHAGKLFGDVATSNLGRSLRASCARRLMPRGDASLGARVLAAVEAAARPVTLAEVVAALRDTHADLALATANFEQQVRNQLNVHVGDGAHVATAVLRFPRQRLQELESQCAGIPGGTAIFLRDVAGVA